MDDRAPSLDRWLPAAQVQTRHRHTAAVDPDALWRAAQEVTLADTRTLGRLVRWRLPGVAPETTYRELFSRPPFTVLEQGPRHSVSGLAGRIWTVRRDYPLLDGAPDFEAWAEPGTVRVAFAHWVEPAPGGAAALVSEARVAPVDRRASRRLRALWAVVGPFERVIGAEPLPVAAERAGRGR